MRLDQRIFFACFCLLVAVVAGGIVHRAVVSPDVQFLMPSLHGDWIVHREPLPGYQRATFVRRFDLPEAPRTFPIELRAMRSAEMTVNGQAFPKTDAPGWKASVHYDVGPALRAGANEIRVVVTNPESPSALLVEADEPVRSGASWTVNQEPEDTAERPAAIPDRSGRFLEGEEVIDRSRWFPALAVYLLVIAWSLVPARSKPTATNGDARRSSARTGFLLCLAVVIAFAVVQLHNVSRYPGDKGFDPVQHAEYVQLMAGKWQVPDASNGWEMSQPPLYYALGAVLYNAFGGAAGKDSVRAVQVFTALTTIAILLPAWWMLSMLYPSNTRMRVLGLSVAAMLPMMFYIGPQVSNEPMAAFVIGGTMALAVSEATRADARWRDAILLGIACGLSLLSKYTGVFVTLSILALAGLRILTGAARADRASGRGAFTRRARHVAWASVVAVVALAMSGWLYAHNMQKFGTPFMGAWDVRSGFRIVQPPGYRTPLFYARFGSVFWQAPSFTRITSFWDGMYGAMWSDSHEVFLDRDDATAKKLSSVVLWLALLPTVGMVLGFVQAVRHLVAREWDHPYFVLVTTSLLTVASTLLFTLEHPWYSTLKAHWALSLVPCAAVFAALGLETMCRHLGPLRYLAYANVAGLGGVVLYLFWYRG